MQVKFWLLDQHDIVLRDETLDDDRKYLAYSKPNVAEVDLGSSPPVFEPKRKQIGHAACRFEEPLRIKTITNIEILKRLVDLAKQLLVPSPDEQQVRHCLPSRSYVV